MTDINEVEQKVLTAIASLADKAAQESVAGRALNYAAAADQLSSAYAWLNSPSQPHGGLSIPG